jgi:hypothetical protein
MQGLEISSDDFRRKIVEAVEEGAYSEAARFWAELCRQEPNNEGHRVEELGALIHAKAWREAEDRAALAVADFPKSIFVRLAQAHVAYRSSDWGLAVKLYERIRREFDPGRFQESLATVLVQLHCYEMMSAYEEARALAVAFWPMLRKSSFKFQHESLLLGTLLDRKYRKQHFTWISRAAPESLRQNFRKRAALANRNSAWLRQCARGVRILSLGQNCLPWMLPNRWGLRPDDVDMKPLGPFDYFATVGDKAAEALESDFEPFLRESALKPFVTGANIPALMNEAMHASFFHEEGNWWSQNDWERLKSVYRRRIADFKTHVRRGRVLYFYAICGAASVERIVDAYHRFLHDKNSRLLIVNLLKEPVSAPNDSPYVRLVHIPYPEDYTWTLWEEFTSDRGIAFEFEIVGEIMKQVRELMGSVGAPTPSEPWSILEAFRGALSRGASR